MPSPLLLCEIGLERGAPRQAEAPRLGPVAQGISALAALADGAAGGGDRPGRGEQIDETELPGAGPAVVARLERGRLEADARRIFGRLRLPFDASTLLSTGMAQDRHLAA